MGDIFYAFLDNGSTTSMSQDHSAAPSYYEYENTQNDALLVKKLIFNIVPSLTTFSVAGFCNAGVLVNGFQIGVQRNGVREVLFDDIRRHADFMNANNTLNVAVDESYQSPFGFNEAELTVALDLNQKLYPGDTIYVRVYDDISDASLITYYMQAMVVAINTFYEQS